ncbi:hypothetical protein [Teichococcus vastitatis]|uniref:Transposase, Mutator family n=1 Tax=Teichococcus vastitatis TaxID=2307076 RepID=A0ABS9W9A2_9PROT|nr:hypothetical protein [Pseudoroseomonas vastitatis]MCI0755558.1 hypothetical protein [Pseudoroseomonas vastitatis]
MLNSKLAVPAEHQEALCHTVRNCLNRLARGPPDPHSFLLRHQQLLPGALGRVLEEAIEPAGWHGRVQLRSAHIFRPQHF